MQWRLGNRPFKMSQINFGNMAKAQSGLTWGDFDRATQQHGLATTGGLVSTTWIAGFTLGGKIGWLGRKQGLTVDNLVPSEVMTPEGKHVKSSSQENQDPFWGLRSGRGNFGIVTRFKYRLHTVGSRVSWNHRNKRLRRQYDQLKERKRAMCVFNRSLFACVPHE
jgi:FAD/FMN-containing dehydrogenase